MKISKELRERIRRLEDEQKKQSQELEELDSLRDLVAIAELEKELAEVSKSGAPGGASAKKASDMDTREAEDVAKAAVGVKPRKKAGSVTNKDIDLSKEEFFRKQKETGKAGKGFVVCLMFNRASPSEWSDESGGGWRGRNLGTRYPNQAEAEKKLKELKAKWPDYPLSILE